MPSEWRKVLHVAVAWRCKRCRVVSVVPDEGGILLCGCGDQPHTDWELQVQHDRGPLIPGIWYDPAEMALDFT
jgi:hypothetical protein